MQIVIFEDKIRAEIGSVQRYRRGQRLSRGECEILIEKLRGGRSSAEAIAKRIGRSPHGVRQLVTRMRSALRVLDDVELGYLAMERGWVAVEDVKPDVLHISGRAPAAGSRP